jgi:Flp pilus assembly protein TadD
MGDLEAAVEQFRRALEYDPDLSDARDNLALALASLEEEASGEKLHPTAEASR